MILNIIILCDSDFNVFSNKFHSFLQSVSKCKALMDSMAYHELYINVGDYQRTWSQLLVNDRFCFNFINFVCPIIFHWSYVILIIL